MSDAAGHGHDDPASETEKESDRRMDVGVLRAVAVAGMLLLAAIDLALKAAAKRYLVEPVDLGLLELRVGYNAGVAFSLGDSLPSGVVLTVTGLITAVLAGLALRAGPGLNRWGRLGITFVLAGAIGNLVDRATDGVVTDYLHTGWFPTFNLADILITMGAAALLLSTIGSPSRRSPEDRTQCAAH